MKLVNPPTERLVVVEFSRDEAERLAASLVSDVPWYETQEEGLYADLYELLEQGLED